MIARSAPPTVAGSVVAAHGDVAAPATSSMSERVGVGALVRSTPRRVTVAAGEASDPPRNEPTAPAPTTTTRSGPACSGSIATVVLRGAATGWIRGPARSPTSATDHTRQPGSGPCPCLRRGSRPPGPGRRRDRRRGGSRPGGGSRTPVAVSICQRQVSESHAAAVAPVALTFSNSGAPTSIAIVVLLLLEAVRAGDPAAVVVHVLSPAGPARARTGRAPGSPIPWLRSWHGAWYGRSSSSSPKSVSGGPGRGGRAGTRRCPRSRRPRPSCRRRGGRASPRTRP